MRYPLKNLLCYFYSPKVIVLLFIFFIIYMIYKRNEPESKKNKLTFKQKFISIVLFFILFIALIGDCHYVYSLIPDYWEDNSFFNIIIAFYPLYIIVFYVVGFLLIKEKKNKTGYLFYALCTIFSFVVIISVLFDFFSCSLYTVASTNKILHSKQGDDVYSPVTGTIAQIGNKKLPLTFSKDSIVIDYPFEYKYKNKKMNVNYQIILSGVKTEYKLGDTVTRACVLGTAAEKQRKINIRCKDLDPYLVSIADDKPVFKDGWYYFGPIFLLYRGFCILDYPLAENKNFVIELSDCSESLEDFYKNRLPAKDEKLVELPHFDICLKTRLESYPVSVPINQISEPEKSMKVLMNELYFSCNMIESDFDSIPVRFYGAYSFSDLKDKYKTGEDIYLYCRAICMSNDRIVFYVKDYTLESPDEYIEKIIEKIK